MVATLFGLKSAHFLWNQVHFHLINVFVNDTVRESGDGSVGEDSDDSEDRKEASNLLDNLAGFFFHGRTDRLLNQVALIKNKFDSVIIIIILDFILILIFVSTMIIFDLIVTISTLSLSPL